MLDEMERYFGTVQCVGDLRTTLILLFATTRSLHDAICIIKRTLESKAVVPGGGAVEAALSIYLEEFAHTLVLLPLSSFKLAAGG
jgi:chaperonin GroEL (HSP60 family)